MWWKTPQIVVIFANHKSRKCRETDRGVKTEGDGHRKLISHTQPKGLGGKRRGRKRGLWFYLAQTPSQSLHQTGWEARSVRRRKINTDAKSHETVKEMDRWGERKRTQKFNRKTLADWKKSNQKQGMWVWNEQIKRRESERGIEIERTHESRYYR